MRRDGRFRLAASTTLALLVAALVMGASHYRTSAREVLEATSRDRALWEGQGAKNPHSAAHYGVYAFKPAPVLSFADRGLDAYLGQMIWLEAHWQNLAQNRPAEDRTAVQRFGELTAASVLQGLIPLLIILLAFGAFAGERDLGTLRQLASLGVPPRTLALGKALGVAGAILALLIPASVAGALGLVLSGSGAVSPDGLRVALLSSGYLLYFTAILGLSLAVSAVVSSSRAALLGLLAFWVLNTLVVPRAAADLSERLYPGPSPSAFRALLEADMANGIDGHSPADQRAKELEAKVLAQYGVREIKDLPVGFAGLRLQASEEHANEVFDRRFVELWDAFERQSRVHISASVAAPFLAVRALSMGLSGTDFAHHRHFATAAEGYRRDLQRLLNAEIVERGKGESNTYMAREDLWRRTPSFRYDAPDTVAVARQQGGAFGMLGLWALGACVFAYVAVSRVQVS